MRVIYIGDEVGEYDPLRAYFDGGGTVDGEGYKLALQAKLDMGQARRELQRKIVAEREKRNKSWFFRFFRGK